MNVSNKKLKIFFHPLDAAGHINSGVGLAQALASRGHEIAFLLDSSFKGHISKYGFRELLLKFGEELAKEQSKQSTTESTDETESNVNPLKLISEKLCKDGFLSDLTPLEKLKAEEDNAFTKELCQKAEEFNDQVKELLEKEKPDLVIVDNFIFEPIIFHSNIPWILLYSCNPLMLWNSKELPPMCSGFAVNSDKETWKEFDDVLTALLADVYSDKQNEILRKFNYPDLELEKGCMMIKSPYMNIYGFPEELDYHDVVPRPEKLVAVDAFCRKMPEPFEFPVEFKNKIKPGDKLVYVSLGSMGSFNVPLMKRMVDILGKTQHKYIVSKGPLHDEYELGDNMWGEEYVAQTLILPLVDLVITHGGNNTVTETFSFGKPMIVMPLFGDQYDNAQRIHEKGFGIRLDAHKYTDQELVDSVDRLLNDAELNQQLRTISERIQNSNSKERACIAIEQLVENYQNKLTNGNQH